MKRISELKFIYIYIYITLNHMGNGKESFEIKVADIYNLKETQR